MKTHKRITKIAIHRSICGAARKLSQPILLTAGWLGLTVQVWAGSAQTVRLDASSDSSQAEFAQHVIAGSHEYRGEASVDPGANRLGRGQDQPVAMDSPFHPDLEAGIDVGVGIVFAPETYEMMRCQDSVLLTGFALSGLDNVDLDLEQFYVTRPGTQFLVGTANGDVPIDHPDIALFRGQVVGYDDSWVFLGITPGFVNGIVHIGPDAEYILAPLSLGAIGQGQVNHGIYNRFSPNVVFPPAKFSCDAIVLPGKDLYVDGSRDDEGIAGFSWRVAGVALEGDFEYASLFSTTDQAFQYSVLLLAAISTIYERDAKLKLVVSFLRVWDTSDDPYSANDTETALDEFKDAWNDNMGSVNRSIAHLLSGKRLGGGRAFVGEICNSNAYGVNGNMEGSFPYPLRDQDSGNWDVVVLAHEMGHNFGTHHTHCFDPPLDKCYNEEDGCWGGARECGIGTIMSYCHTCTNGLRNIDLEFHPSCVTAMRNYTDRFGCAAFGRDPCFVDFRNGGSQDGTSSHPYRSVLHGVWFVIPGGVVRIQAGTYDEQFFGAFLMNRPMTLTTTAGSVRIGG